MSSMVVKKHRGTVEAWGPVSPSPVPKSASGRPLSGPPNVHVMYQFSPAPYAVKEEIKKLTRPKSTPAHLARVDEEFSTDERPHTVPYGGVPPGCDRIDQLEHEPTRKHNFHVHLPARKNRTPPWQRSLESPPVPFQSSPGFEFAKSKERIQVKIKMEDFFDRPEPELKPKRRPGLDPAIEALIAQLQEQINDLTVYLEEERLNHRDTIRRADEVLREKMAVVLAGHEEEVRRLKEDKDQTVTELTEQYEKQIQEQRDEMTAQIEKMKGEIEFLQSAFESYKTSLHAETTEKWKKREEEMINKHEEELETKLLELRTNLMTEFNAEKSQMKKDHQKVLDRLDKDHKLEIESLAQKFSRSALELEKLQGINKQYEELRREHLHITKKHKEVTNKLSSVATELSDTKIKLLEYEASFHQRVQQVDDKYKTEIHSLMTENSELRRSYMRKCAELYDAKVKYEKMIEEKDMLLSKALEKVEEPQPVKHQEVTDIIDSTERRGSGPITDRERRLALLTVSHEPLISLVEPDPALDQSDDQDSVDEY